jgi:hypothetical protein
MSCVKTFILGKNEIYCMNCNKEWNRDFIDSTFTKSFRTKELQKYRENVLLAREKAMMSDTVSIYERQHGIYQDATNEDPELPIKRRTFYKPCPRNGCTSLLSSRYRCTDPQCKTFVCSDCDGLKEGFNDNTHVCNQGDVDTVKLKAKDCKRCPLCHIETYKIDGCDQVWCPPPCGAKDGRNGTQWLFSTGLVDTCAPHAPLYYKYISTINNGFVPRNAGDVCGRNETYNIIAVAAYLVDFVKDYEYTRILQIHGLIRGMLFDVRWEFNPNLYNNDTFNSNIDLRILVLENRLSEDKWKLTLQRREKAKHIKMAHFQLMQVFIYTTSDLFNVLLNTDEDKQHELIAHKRGKLANFLDEIKALCVYYNDCLIDIHKRFNIKVKLINFDNQ